MSDNRVFTIGVRRWTYKKVEQMELAMKTTIEDVLREAQTQVSNGGNMPVDIGNLRNSLTTSLDGAQVGEDSDSYIIALPGMELGMTLDAAWTAKYAIARHYKPKSFGQGGGMWRDKAVQRASIFWKRNIRAVK